MYKQINNYLITALLAMFILKLAFTSKLTFYIHPRYQELTILAGIIILLMGISGLWHSYKSLQFKWPDYVRKNRAQD